MKKQSKQLYGQVRKSGSLAGFGFTETIYPEKLKLPFHSHDFAYFCFVLGGNFTEKIEEKEYLCQPSTAVFHPIGETHSDYFHTPSRCFNVQNNSELNRLTTRLYQEFYNSDEFSVLTIEGLMLEITGEFLRDSVKKTKQSAPKWLLTARDFISEEFKNDLTISAISTMVNVHPTHLAKEFRRYFQLTIGDFIRQRRIEFACRKIVNSNAPLSQISLEAGFYDQSHFTRIFRKVTQMTPTTYRTIYRNR